MPPTNDQSAYLVQAAESEFEEDGVDFCPGQFEKPASRGTPLKEISLALVLMISGTLCLVLFLLNFFKIYQIYEKQHEPVLLSLALLTLIPGVYHVRLAWMAWLNFPGYSYDEFSDLN